MNRLADLKVQIFADGADYDADYSRETVQVFYKDAAAAGYQIEATRFAAE
jgi:hypothetical protein